MNIGEKAFTGLFPNREKKKITVKYSKAFSPYNGNITCYSDNIDFRLSDQWKEVSEDIQIGLAQHLLHRVYKSKEKTLNIELYEKFMEKISRYSQRHEVHLDPELEESFHRINKEYFHDFMEMPMIEWGSYSTTQLGTYSYSTDTVRISTIFKGSGWELDYVLYHELLHKKFGLRHSEGSCRHHPPEFRALERKFKVKDAERKLTAFVNKARRTKPEPQTKVTFWRNIFK